MYWKNEQTTSKESPSKNTVSDTLITYMSYCAFFLYVLLAILTPLLFY